MIIIAYKCDVFNSSWRYFILFSKSIVVGRILVYNIWESRQKRSEPTKTSSALTPYFYAFPFGCSPSENRPFLSDRQCYINII